MISLASSSHGVVFIELGELDQQAVTQIFCRHTDWIKPLDPLKDGFNFVDVNLFIAHTFENIFQRDSQITGVINGIDDRGNNRAVSVGENGVNSTCTSGNPARSVSFRPDRPAARRQCSHRWCRMVYQRCKWCPNWHRAAALPASLFLFERVGGVQCFTVLRFAGVDFFMSVDLLKQRIALQRLL